MAGAQGTLMNRKDESMDLFQAVLFASIIVGILLLVFALFLFTVDNKNSPNQYFEASNTIRALETSVEEIEKTMDELNATAKTIFDELDGKYNELLFLYQLIDAKKTETAQTYHLTEAAGSGGKLKAGNGRKAQAFQAESLQQGPLKQDSKAMDNPRLKEILALKNEGMTVSDIAQKLDMGQGEVKLILELGKVR